MPARRYPGQLDGDLVRDARLLLGWSQFKLGQYLGVSRPRVTQIERGDRLRPRLANKVREVLEAQGCLFVGGGRVRLVCKHCRGSGIVAKRIEDEFGIRLEPRRCICESDHAATMPGRACTVEA